MVVEYTKEAQKFLDKQDSSFVENIKIKISNLPLGDVQKLKGLQNSYRLRVGKVRILFERVDEKITVFDIGYRGDIYK